MRKHSQLFLFYVTMVFLFLLFLGANFSTFSLASSQKAQNQAQSIQDPSVLPGFNVTVGGVLKNNWTGIPYPNAPVDISAFNETFASVTNNQGFFSYTITVPSNATVGSHTIIASFAPNGSLKENSPAFNSTTVVVNKLVIRISLSAPFIIYAGIPTKISGVATCVGPVLPNSSIVSTGAPPCDGNPVDNTLIELNTPWGIFNATTDSSGRFNFPVTIPLTEFGFSQSVSAIASPTAPYYILTPTSVDVSILNLIIVVIIVCILSFGIYEARNLDIHFPKRSRAEQVHVAKNIEETVILESLAQVPTPKLTSLIVQSYIQALSIAAKKFAIRFYSSMTIRETVRVVAQYDKEAKGLDIFAKIAVETENFLYSKSGPTIDIQAIRSLVLELDKAWSPARDV